MADLLLIAEVRGPKSANVIFFHGLGGNPLETWTSPPPGNAVWPKWLAEDLQGITVFSISYDAPVSDRDRATMHPTDLASNVLNRLLVDSRLQEGEMILIGHSLGGLVIKLMLRRAEAEKNRRAEAASFIDRVRKVAFLATPHSGADLAAWGYWLRVLVRPSPAVLSLVRNDANLRELNEGCCDLVRDREVVHLILTERSALIIRRKVLGVTYFRKNLGMIVKPDSSDPGLSPHPVPIPVDHIAIAKPADRESEIYRHIRFFIERPTERPRNQFPAIPEGQDQLERKVLEWLDRGGETAKAAEGGLEWQAFRELVRLAALELTRHQKVLERARQQLVGLGHQRGEAIDSVEQTLREFRNAVSIAVDVISKGQVSSKDQGNINAFIDEVLKRVAEMTNKGDLDGSTKTLDDALVELSQRGQEQRQSLQISEKALLEAGIKQDLLRRDPWSVANRVEALAALDATNGSPLWSQVYRDHFNTFYAQGEEKGINLSLEVAIEMARRMVASAPTGDQRGIALNMLGNALWRLGDRESGTGRLEEAVVAYHEALQELARERVPLQWAETQNNLGNALRALGQRESGTDRLVEAVAAFHEALQERTRERVPLPWAATESDLGSALWRLGEHETGTARLEDAVTAFREALKERTRVRAPLDWATTQNVLGNALRDLGERENRTARLEEAVTAYREALKERTRERVPLEWATTLNNLANVFRALGKREAGTARLEEAIAAYRDALKEVTRERVPLRWAMTQSNLAEAFLTFFHKDHQPHHLDAAIEAVDGVLEEYRKANAAFLIEKAGRLRENILAAKANSVPPRPPVPK